MTRNHRFTECKEFQISLSKLIKDQYNLATSSIWDQLTCWLARPVCYLLQVESHIRPQSLRLTDSQTVTGARVEDFRPLYERMTFDTRSSFCSKRPRRVFVFFLAKNCVSSQKSPAVFINICSAFLHRESGTCFHRHLHWMHSRNLNTAKLINELFKFLVHSV